MKCIRVSLLIILILICFNISMASVFYVDPSKGGTDNNSGLTDRPWGTIQHAASTAKAGDTVYVQPAIYHEKITFKNSGTEGAPISFIGIGSVVIEGTPSTTLWTGIMNINNKSYIRIRNFTLQNSYWYGIYVENGTYIYLENNKTYNTGASGISVWHSSNVYAAANTVRKACYQSLSTGSQECITFSGVNNFEIHDNEVFESGGSNNGGEGIDAKENCSNGKIYNNHVHDLIRLGIYADSWDKTLSNIDIYNNRIYACSEGIVVSSENGGVVDGLKIYNNLTYNNKHFGITISNYDKDGLRKNISVMNNTVYDNGYGDDNSAWGGGIIIYTTNISDISIFNNIVASNDAMQISDQSGLANIHHNLIYGYRGLNWTSEVKGSNVLLEDPLFTDPDGDDDISGNMDDDLSLKPESPAINTGSLLNAPAFDFNYYVRPAEGIADLGAFEYNSSPLSIKIPSDPKAADHIQIYPNPGNGLYNICCLSQIEFISIFDQRGVLVKQYIKPFEVPLKIIIADPGIYMIHVATENSSSIQKIINFQ